MQMHPSLFSVAFAMALAATPAPAAPFYVTTGLGTVETTISSSSSPSWFLGPQSPIHSHLRGAVVAIKHGPDTTFGIKFELLNNSNALLASLSYTDVGAFISAGGQSDYAKFIFALPGTGGVALPTGFFTVKLSLVGVGGGEGETYSILGLNGAMTLTTDSAANIVVTNTNTTTTTTTITTPEPATAFILAAGLLGLGLTRRRGASVAVSA